MKKEKQNTYHHGNLRQTLLDVALRMIDEEGIRTLSLRELARRAQVSQAAPYRHFSSKEDLIASVAEQGFGLLAKKMTEVLTHHKKENPVKQFQELGIAYVFFAAQHPAYLRLMFGSALSPTSSHVGLQNARQEVASFLIHALAACRDAGYLQEGKLDDLAMCAWSMVHGLSMLIVEGRLLWLTTNPLDSSLETIRAMAHQATSYLFLGIGNGKKAD